jgi:hypothetical protein
MSVQYRTNDQNAGAIPVDTVIETELQDDGSQRQVVSIGNSALPTGAATSASEVALGNITGRMSVNKFGEAPNGIQTTATDIWSRADATPTQQIWLAPTAARVHALVSSSAADTGFNVRVRGLTSWSTAETSELVAMNGQTPVNTANSYVIIHRMNIIPTAAKVTNAGAITATAADDSTVTAVILAGDGQTEMAIYGVPSVQKALLHRWSCSIDKATAAAVSVDFILRVNENPNVQTTGYLRKDDMTLQSTGTNSQDRRYAFPLAFAGPCIIKIQGVASAADVDGKAGFDLELVTI